MSYLIETLIALFEGMKISLLLFLCTLFLAFPIGVLLARLQQFKSKVIRTFLAGYLWFFRGTPLMLQLFLFLYGLPELGIRLERLHVAILAFGLNYAAYFTEIIRAGLSSIDSEQSEAAAVMGATNHQIYRHILLPQALSIQIPTFANETITLIKDTALVTAIALSDVMRVVREIVSRDFTVSPFVIASAFYLLMTLMISMVYRFLEDKKKIPMRLNQPTLE